MTGRRGPGRVPARAAASSPPRRTTRNQLQQHHEEAGQDEQQFIDPTLTDTIRAAAQGTEMPPPPLPPARRGTRSKPRSSSIASSLHGKTSEVYSSDASQSPYPPSKFFRSLLQMICFNAPMVTDYHLQAIRAFCRQTRQDLLETQQPRSPLVLLLSASLNVVRLSASLK